MKEQRNVLAVVLLCYLSTPDTLHRVDNGPHMQELCKKMCWHIGMYGP